MERLEIAFAIALLGLFGAMSAGIMFKAFTLIFHTVAPF